MSQRALRAFDFQAIAGPQVDINNARELRCVSVIIWRTSMKTAIKQNNSSKRFIVVLLCLCALLPVSGDAQRQGSQRSSAQRLATNKPKLVLVIVVDQFRYDYLERFGDLFVSGGFKRLMTEGALFTSANYDYVPTYT